jgi:hypothetical protein
MSLPRHARSFVALAATLTYIGSVATARAQTFDVKQLEVTNGAIDYGPETMFARGVRHDRGSDVNRHANEQDGFALNYAWQFKYDLRQGFGIGVEGFGVVDNLGDPPPVSEQEHRIGPVVFTEIELSKDFKIAADVGLLFGLTPATPDVALKVNFGVPLYRPSANGK